MQRPDIQPDKVVGSFFVKRLRQHQVQFCPHLAKQPFPDAVTILIRVIGEEKIEFSQNWHANARCKVP